MCILVSDKSEVPPLYRSIAMNFDGAMAFGMAPASMAQRFGVQKVRVSLNDLGTISARLPPRSRHDLGVISAQAPALFIIFPGDTDDKKLGPDGKPRQPGEHQLQVAMFQTQARPPTAAPADRFPPPPRRPQSGCARVVRATSPTQPSPHLAAPR